MCDPKHILIDVFHCSGLILAQLEVKCCTCVAEASLVKTIYVYGSTISSNHHTSVSLLSSNPKSDSFNIERALFESIGSKAG